MVKQRKNNNQLFGLQHRRAFIRIKIGKGSYRFIIQLLVSGKRHKKNIRSALNSAFQIFSIFLKSIIRFPILYKGH